MRLMHYGFRPARFPLAMAHLDGDIKERGQVGNVVCSVAGGFVGLARFQAETHLGIVHR